MIVFTKCGAMVQKAGRAGSQRQEKGEASSPLSSNRLPLVTFPNTRGASFIAFRATHTIGYIAYDVPTLVTGGSCLVGASPLYPEIPDNAMGGLRGGLPAIRALLGASSLIE